MKTKPFDLQAALAGKPWGTRDGRKGAFLAHDPGGREACRVVCRFEGITYLTTRHEDGREDFGKTHPGDLVMLPKKKTVYVNLYNDGTAYWHHTEPYARAVDCVSGIAVAVPVEIEE